MSLLIPISRLWSSGCRSRYQGMAGRFRFVRSPFCIIGKQSASLDSKHFIHQEEDFDGGNYFAYETVCCAMASENEKLSESTAWRLNISFPCGAILKSKCTHIHDLLCRICVKPARHSSLQTTMQLSQCSFFAYEPLA